MYLLLYSWYIELVYCLIFLMLYGYLFIYSLLNFFGYQTLKTIYYYYSFIVLLMWRLDYFAVTAFFLLSLYGSITRNRLTVSLGLPLIMFIVVCWNCQSTMYAINNIDSLEVLSMKCIFDFTERLTNCENTIMKCINNSLGLRFDIWSPWNELLFIW